MKFNSDVHHRRSIRLKHFDYSQAGAYFFTICTRNRECLFGEIKDETMRLNEMGTVIQTVWSALPARYPNVALDACVVMPNHVHGIIVIVRNETDSVGAIHELPLRHSDHELSLQRLPPQNDLSRRRRMLIPKVVGFFKVNTAKEINRIRNTPGIPVWQRNYYEHIIRDEGELQRIRAYIAENPLRWQWDEENPFDANTAKETLRRGGV
jgi:putative transposase